MGSRILVDTSVWIPFFNGLENPKVDYLKDCIKEDRHLVLCPIIVQEILQGIREDEDYENVKDSLLAFPIPNWSPVEASINAAQIYRYLRKKGVTIRKSNNCLIAAYAQHFDLSVLHEDRDFFIMAKHRIIRVIELN